MSITGALIKTSVQNISQVKLGSTNLNQNLSFYIFLLTERYGPNAAKYRKLLVLTSMEAVSQA